MCRWVCDPYHLRFHKQCLVYSIGSNNQFDFENGLLAQYPHCEVHTFDHTSSPPGPRDNQAVNFHSLRLSTFDDMDSHNITLPTAIKLLSHTGRWINILKIDIEGDEYKVLRPLLKQGSLLQNVVQILIELHTPPLTAPQFHELMTGFHSLGFAIFSKEPNTEGCGGDCIEYSLLRLTPAVFAQNATQEH
jgi:FkbM family methyltransferase